MCKRSSLIGLRVNPRSVFPPNCRLSLLSSFYTLGYRLYGQDLARREQARRDSDAWITVQRLKRAKLQEDRETVRMAKAQGRDWRDPEGGVEMGMNRREGRGLGAETGRVRARENERERETRGGGG